MMTLSLQARVIFVKAGNNGDGSSWSNAFGDLQQALKVASYGDQIWVTVGKYLPTRTSDRTVSFQIPDGVALYGGFQGFENDVDERNWRINTTILSGEIGSNSLDDNSYTVVYTKGVSSATIIDGFVITSGFANYMGSKSDVKRCGAGWYNDGSFGESNPTIRNCTFTKNYARDGAALYNFALNGATNPTIQNCYFIANRADLDGGAIYNDGNKGTCNPHIENCAFEKNEATYGACIINVADKGQTLPTIVNSNFIGNISYIRGSSIYDTRSDSGICETTLQNCQFADNSSGVGKDTTSIESSMEKKNR